MSEPANIAIDRERIVALCQHWRIVEFSLFGSVLGEEFRPDSDVDVLVSFAPDAPWSMWDVAELREQLVTMFGRDVDVVEKEGIRNPFRRAAILGHRRVLYAA